MTWQDPYGQSGWEDPYGHGPYGQYDQYGRPDQTDPHGPYGQYGHGYVGPPIGPPARPSGLTIAALMANIISAVVCCGIGLAWLPGVILCSVALNRGKTDPATARRLTMWAWVCFVANVVVTITIIVLVGAFSGDPSSSGSVSTGTP